MARCVILAIVAPDQVLVLGPGDVGTTTQVAGDLIAGRFIHPLA